MKKNYEEPMLDLVRFDSYHEIALTLISNEVGSEDNGLIGDETIPEV